MASMKIALNLESFHHLNETEAVHPADVVHLARELGVDGVELSGRMVAPDREPELLEALDRTGVEVPSCYLFSDLLTPHVDARAEQVRSLQSRLEVVSRLRARRATIIPGALPDGVDPDLARGWIVDSLKQCLPTAKNLGLQVSIENVGFQAGVYARARDLAAICDSVGPEMQLTFDAGNFLFVEEDAVQAFNLLAPRVSHVHLKDWQSIEPSAPPVAIEVTGTDGIRYCGAVLGSGVMKLPGVVRQLSQYGYSGFLSIEYEGVDDPFDAMREGVRYLRSIL
jgi:sugar phosphate isomerase/epimerase